MIKLLIGKSPYTKWNFTVTPPKGVGYELFKNFLIAKEKFQPDYFLYETSSYAREIVQQEISAQLAAPLISFDSSLVSAQLKPNLFATNIPNIQPPIEVSPLLMKDIINPKVKRKRYVFESPDDKPPTPSGLIRLGHIYIPRNGRKYKVYSLRGKGCTLNTDNKRIEMRTGLYYTNGVARPLTLWETRKLQTIPNWVKFPLVDARAIEQICRGSTIEVLKQIFKNIPNAENEEFIVLSMYDGMGCGCIALKDLGFNIKKYISVENDKRAIRVLDENFPDRIGFKNAADVRDNGSELSCAISALKN